MKYTIQQVNCFKFDQHIHTFQNVIENCPTFAEMSYGRKPFTSINDIITAVNEFLYALINEDKQRILLQHPELSGKFENQQLTEESVQEQCAAQLNLITGKQRDDLIQLNTIYKKKFGFPFVICAHGNNYESIVNALNVRMNIDDVTQELTNGIEEVKKIAKLRLYEIILV